MGDASSLNAVIWRAPTRPHPLTSLLPPLSHNPHSTGRNLVQAQQTPFAPGLNPVLPQCYLADTKLVRLSLKLHGMLPEELPPNLAQQLQHLVANDKTGAATATLLQGAMRPGCVHLAIDVLVAAPHIPSTPLGGDDDTPGVPTRDKSALAEVGSELELCGLLPAPALARLLLQGDDGARGLRSAAAAALARGAHVARLCHAQVGVGWVTVIARDGHQHIGWGAAPGDEVAPRLLAALPCAVRSDDASSARLVVVGTNVPVDSTVVEPQHGRSSGLYVRSRGFYHPVPPPRVVPTADLVAAAASAPDVQQLKQCFVMHIPPAALGSGLLLLEAETLPCGTDAACTNTTLGPLYSNQLPVVVSEDPLVISELRQLEWALLNGGEMDTRGGACRWVLGVGGSGV